LIHGINIVNLKQTHP